MNAQFRFIVKEAINRFPYIDIEVAYFHTLLDALNFILSADYPRYVKY